MKKLIRIKYQKLLRYLRLTKPIQLSNTERSLILLCKGHLKNKYRTNAGNWIDTLKPMFHEIYGYNPDEYKQEFLNCIFNKLLDTYLKIQYDQSGSNAQLKEIFKESFSRTWRRDYELPIERAIAELCGLIQCNLVGENGIPRYILNYES